jgi:ribosomal protein L29
MARFNINTANVAELEAQHAQVAAEIAEARAQIAAGGLDERNRRNFVRYVIRAQEWNRTIAGRIEQLNYRAQRLVAEGY